MAIHKISSLMNKYTLCGINVKDRPDGETMTLFQLNITCHKCKELYKEEIERIIREEK